MRIALETSTEDFFSGSLAVVIAVQAAGTWERAVKFGLIDQSVEMMENLQRMVPAELGGTGFGNEVQAMMWETMVRSVYQTPQSRAWLNEMQQQVLEREASMQRESRLPQNERVAAPNGQ